MAEPEITVGHWTISDHFWQLSDQKSICSDKVSGQSDNKYNIIFLNVRPKFFMSEHFWACSDNLSGHFRNLISGTDMVNATGKKLKFEMVIDLYINRKIISFH